MRFIRDIIKEKRTESVVETSDAAEGTELDAPVAPLVLKSRVFDEPEAATETPEMDNSAPVQPEEEMDAQEAFMNAGAASEEDQELADYEDYDDDDEEVRSLLDAIDRERMANVTAVEAPAEKIEDPDDAQNFAEDDILDADVEQYLNRPDPFDKLRETRQSEAPVQKTISPIRSSGLSAVKEPAEPVAAFEPEAVAKEEPFDALTPAADAMEAPVHMPSPAKGRGSGRSGRVKTRLLGFSAGTIERDDPFEKKPGTTGSNFPVGWLVVVSEMGRGASFALQDGVSRVGRGTDQTVCLNFGDNSISRDNHISIAYDSEQNKFFIGQSGKTNMVRVNNVPLLSTEELKSKDLIRLGETTLRFIAFCADDFSWTQAGGQVAKHA